jgi:hypothetical protein
MSQPRNGWTLEQALDLLAQGYPRRTQLTGWHAQQLQARHRRRSHPGPA